MNTESDRNVGFWVLLATILPSSMAFIDQSALNVILPAIQGDLGSTGPQLLWFVSGYTLMLASLILLGGTLGDTYGRKRIFMIGIFVFTLASAACAISPTSTLLIAARIVQGAGGAMMIPGSLSLISTHFAPDRRGRAIGTWSAVTTITTAGGPVLGGVLAQAGLWRVVFLINVPLGIASLIALALRVPESRRPGDRPRIDIAGAVLITLSLAAVAYAFIEAPAIGFGAPAVIAGLCIGAAALVVFIIAERAVDAPMMPLSVFRSLSFSGANLLTLFLYGALSAFSFFLPLTLVQAQGYRESQAGLTLLPFVVLLAGLSRWAGRIMDRTGPRLPLVLGPALVGVGFLVTSFVGPGHGASTYWQTYFPGIVLFGAGMGITVAPLTTTVMSSLSSEMTGTASGVNNAVSRVAGLLAVSVLGSVALFHFGSFVVQQASNLPLTAAQQQALAAQTANLGNTRIPAGVPQQTAEAISAIIRHGMIGSFRLVMYICAALAWLSAVFSAALLRGQTKPAR